MYCLVTLHSFRFFFYYIHLFTCAHMEVRVQPAAVLSQFNIPSGACILGIEAGVDQQTLLTAESSFQPC